MIYWIQKKKVVQLVLFNVMIYTVTKWTIKKLQDTYKKGILDLSPPYQRNFIWSINDQQALIASILKGNPIPNFFLLKKSDKSYEMVDGQQRSRTILSFLSGQFEDFNGKKYSESTHVEFLKYEFPVTIITDIKDEPIHKFYAMVNKTGIHLNKPEVRKADYFESNILKLVDEINVSKKFKTLKLFTEGTMKRMNDVEFISELIVLLMKGHVDKKAHIDEYFSNDLTTAECAEINIKFNNILDKIISLNNVFEFNKTRFKQRNDFYTLFDFVQKHSKIKVESLIYFYKLLVLISSDIRPTQESCEVLREYARNCVTQSNSRFARDNRLIFLESLLLNSGKIINDTQKQIITFYKLDKKSTIRIEEYLEIDIVPLIKLKPLIFHGN